MPFDPNSPNVVEGLNDDDEPIHREVLFFGRDVQKIPCFKESFLYGILGGIGTGLFTFMATSRVGFSTNAAVYSLTGIVLIYWFNCRHTISQTKFTIAQTQRALEEMDRRRGTALDPLVDSLGENQTKD